MLIRLHLLSFLCAFGIFTHDLTAQYSPHIGISVGGMLLSGGSGFMFESPKAQPHREFGLTAGLDLYYPLLRDLHLMVGAHGRYEKSHFHLGLGGDFHDTGYFQYGYLSVPITLNHMGNGNRKKVKIKEFFGFAFNFGNYLKSQAGELVRSPFLYQTSLVQKSKVNPEFIMGVGIGGKYHSYGMFHWELGLHIDLLKNQVYTASLTPTVAAEDPQVAVREMRGVMAMARLIFFPRIHIAKKQCYRN